MRVDLDLTFPEYFFLKKKYPILKDEKGYYFQTQNPYISNGFGLCVGLPVELEKYIIYKEDEEDSE